MVQFRDRAPPLFRSSVPMVTRDGKPTPEFIRAWQQQRELNKSTEEVIVELNAATAAIAALTARRVDGTAGRITGGGTLGAGNITLDLAATAVTPGSYTNTDLTVDAFGRITAAANGSGGSGGSAVLSPADTPPASGSIYDDEFNDGTIDPSWTNLNFGAGIAFSEGDFGLLGEINGDTTQIRGLCKPVPPGATGFTITVGVNDVINKGNPFSGVSLFITEGTALSSAARAMVFYQAVSGQLHTWDVTRQEYSALGTRSLNVTALDTPASPAYMRMRVYNDAGTWRADYSFSRFGLVYTAFNTGVALGFTPSQMGFGMYDRSGTGARAMFRWFRVTDIV